MGPGLPGFGIASIFYIVAAILAPARVAWVARRRPDVTARWSTAWTQCAIGWTMLAALVGFYLFLDLLVTRGILPVSQGPTPLRVLPNWIYAVITLGVVLLIGSLAGTVASLRRPDDAAAAVAAGHAAGVAPMVLELRQAEHAPVLQPPLGPSEAIPARSAVDAVPTPRWRPSSEDEVVAARPQQRNRAVRWWPAALLDEAHDLVIDLRDTEAQIRPASA